MSQQRLLEQAQQVIAALKQHNLTLTTAESCTGGLLASALTAMVGASSCFGYGFVTYSNQAKQQLLGVPEALLAEHGAVSAEVACAMAEGALAASSADWSIAITGIAGPGGGSNNKPVGLVQFAWASSEHATRCQEQRWQGERIQIQQQAAHFALQQLYQWITV